MTYRNDKVPAAAKPGGNGYPPHFLTHRPTAAWRMFYTVQRLRQVHGHAVSFVIVYAIKPSRTAETFFGPSLQACRQ